MTRLVLNADDVGLTLPLSAEAVALRACRAITDVSLLSVGSAFAESAAGLRNAGIDTAGVHLCLVGAELPLSAPAQIRSLLRGARFRGSWPSVAVAAASGRLAVAEVEREWEAQITRVLDAGLRVTHLDGHQHLHLLPSLLPIAIRLARRFSVPMIRAPRGDDPAGCGGSVSPLSRMRAGLLSRFGHAARRKLRAAGLPEPPRVLGLAEAGRMTLERWSVLLESLSDAGDFEVALHPGVDDAGTRTLYRWGYSWAEESAALRSPELHAAFAARGISTVSFSEL
ncbi:MAG: ChbG/HpnK family deacetylase [Thermoanaerobaculia bacterium]